MRPPLPLAPFERYMLEDDRPGFPMVFYVRLRFSGGLDRAALELALTRSAKRHPLLRSVVRSWRRCLHWFDAPRKAPRLTWHEGDRPTEGEGGDATLHGGPIDLRRELGVRADVWSRRDAAEIVLTFHHACCDGIGAAQFVDDLLTSYAALLPGATSLRSLRPIDPARLSRRTELRSGLFKRLVSALLCPAAIFGIVQFFWNRPRPIDASRKGPHSPEPLGTRPASCRVRLSREQLGSLRAAAADEGGTINDALLTELFATIAEWNRESAASRDGCVRVCMPVNLRSSSDDVLSAANKVSMVFLDRRPARYRSPRALFRSLRRDTWFVKRFGMARFFLTVLSWIGRTKRGLKRLLDGDRCMASAILSNLGVQLNDLPLPYRRGRVMAGESILEAIEFLPPLRPHTHAAIAASTYAGELTLAMQYNPEILDAAAARSFLMSFARRLHPAAGMESEAAPKRRTEPDAPLRSGQTGRSRELPVAIDDKLLVDSGLAAC